MNTEEQEKESFAGNSCSCSELLQAVIDGQATEEQVIYFQQHMEECSGCSSSYHVDTTLRSLVRVKCCGNPPPSDLIDQIREKIRNIS
jgi:mycothiol system anti-sigma-R factor